MRVVIEKQAVLTQGLWWSLKNRCYYLCCKRCPFYIFVSRTSANQLESSAEVDKISQVELVCFI
jgi:hypothetical protein